MTESENVVHTVDIDGHRVVIEIHKRRAPQWVPGRNGRRGYYSISQAEYCKAPRIYPSFPGESLLQNLANRTTRPSAVMGKILRQAMKEVGLEGRISWSQKAGCSCPCSPGWIWHDAPSMIGDMYRYDAWATFTDVPAARDDEAAVMEQVGRAAQIIADPTMPDLSGVRL